MMSYEFANFRLDPTILMLFRDGEPVVKLGRRGAAILAALIEQPGQIVTKTTLVDAAWQGAAVEESNLSVQIARLRKVLGPAPGGGPWIATVPRVGYRFVGAAPRPLGTPMAALTVAPLLAVLPFANLSEDTGHNYLAEGVFEDVLTALSSFKSFATVAGSSSHVTDGRYLDARVTSQDLGVRYLLLGSVRRFEARLRISCQLVEGGSSARLWARNFDVEVDQVFNVLDRIVEAVVAVVEPHIERSEIERSSRERPQSMAAYDLYLRGRSLLYSCREADNLAAYTLLAKSVSLEPENVAFLAGASQAIQRRLAYGWGPVTLDDRATCLELARHGLLHVDRDASAMALFGMSLINAKEQEVGFSTVRRALKINPNSLVILITAAIAHLHCGDVDEAEALFRRAMLLGPHDPNQCMVITGLARIAMIRQRFEEALHWAKQSLSTNESYCVTYWVLIAASALLGRKAEADRYLARFKAMDPSATTAGIRQGQPNLEAYRMDDIVNGLSLAGLPRQW